MNLRKEPLSSIIGGKVLSFRNLKYLSIIQMHMFSETIHLQNYSISSEKILLLFSHCCVQLFATPRMAAHQALIFSTISQNLLKFMSTKSMMPSNHLIICRPILLLTSIFPSIRIFSNKLALHIRWPKYWSFSFSVSFSNEYSGLIPLGLTGLISAIQIPCHYIYFCKLNVKSSEVFCGKVA